MQIKLAYVNNQFIKKILLIEFYKDFFFKLYRVIFLFLRTLKRYNKSNINRLFKRDKSAIF